MMSPLKENVFCIAFARKNRFAMDARGLAIDQGHEPVVQYTDVSDEYVSGVAISIDLTAPG